MAVGVEHVNKTEAAAGNIVVLLRVLLRVGYEQVAVNVLDTKRSISSKECPDR